jgi:hypothetical protein
MYTPAPLKKPNMAQSEMFFRYHVNDIFSSPIAATPAADPMISILPPVPAV